MFKETFYWIYKYWVWRNVDSQSFFNAYLGVMLCQIINIITLGGLFRNHFNGFDFEKPMLISIAIILYLLLSLFNFYYLYSRRYEILNEIDGYSSQQLIKSKRNFRIYITLSAVFLCLVLLLMD